MAAELGMHTTLRNVRHKQKQAEQSLKKYHEEKVSRVNAIKLMRMHERRAKEGVWWILWSLLRRVFDRLRNACVSSGMKTYEANVWYAKKNVLN